MYAGLIVRLVDHSGNTEMLGVGYKCPNAGIMRLSSLKTLTFVELFLISRDLMTSQSPAKAVLRNSSKQTLDEGLGWRRFVSLIELNGEVKGWYWQSSNLSRT
jgi:hypothetical protein